MILSTASIIEYIREGKIKIEPFDENSLKEASYALKLSESIEIPPHGFVLGLSSEKITLSPTVACFVSTKSSIARRGIDIAQSSSFCSPETDNQITFEIVNHSESSVSLEKGEAVAKTVFVQVV